MRNLGLLLLRLSIGTMLIHHGYEKTADIENFADAFVRPIGIPFPILASYIAAYSEIYGSWLLIGGLFTRIAALSIVGTIYLLELLVLYMGGALCILLLGGGDYSIDRLLKKFGIKYNKPHIPFT